MENNSKKINLKNFLLFSLFIYPIALLFFIFHGTFLKFFGSGLVLFLAAYVFFSIVNYIFGQSRIKLILVYVSCFFGLTLVFIWLNGSIIIFNPNILINLIGSVVIYFSSFLVFQFAQFLTWVPFILNYIWHNRRRLDNMTFD